ncbi:hypothetical protein ACTJIJ_02045 [Niabella sp. 22666]|uniref:hypothetical protein n=1 Tax=Niabella sp. 22666 TaxID=3453954 RepID=UPI003F87A945
MEKVFGVVILYNPPDEVNQHLKTYIDRVEKLFVVDNSEPAAKRNYEEFGDKVVLIADGVNRGISERLNDAAERAIREGGHWLLTMDQDSFFSEGSLDAYMRCLDGFTGKENVGMFGIEYEKKSTGNDCEVEETTNLITSGSMVNLSLFHEIGAFDEQLFIDEVDAEYCLKSKQKGYKTIRFKNVLLNHSLGVVSQHRSLKNFKSTPRTLHSPLRVYYMVRNFLYISNLYKKDQPETFAPRKKAIINRIKNNFLYGTNKVLLVKYLWLAYRHFQMGKMGKLKK